MLWTILAAGCGDKGDDSGGGHGSIDGTILPDTYEVEGEVAGTNAFAFDQAGVFVAYISSNPNATCDEVAGYVTQYESDEVFDPKNVLAGGMCNIYVYIDQVTYDGSLDAARKGNEETIDTVATGTSIHCAMGEGEFTVDETQHGDSDFYWTGENAHWWQGFPTAYEWSFAGGDGSNFSLTMDMTAYKGTYVHESMDEVLATGSVAGTVTAEWCPGLGSVISW